MKLLLALAPLLQTTPADPTPRLSAEAARADLALMRRTLVEIHPGFGRYEPATDTERALEEFDELDARLGEGVSLGQLHLELSLLAARLRCGHTRVEAPPALAELRAGRATPGDFVLNGVLVDGGTPIELLRRSASTPASPAG